MPVIENLVREFGSLPAVMEASIEELDDVKVSVKCAKAIKKPAPLAGAGLVIDSYNQRR